MYKNILGEFWDDERKYIDEQYKTIPFPFHEAEIPGLTIEQEWTIDQLLGYLHTWSAVHHYQKKNKIDPIQKIQAKLTKAWGKDIKKKIEFPIYLRLGKLQAFTKPVIIEQEQEFPLD